ncbi:MAG: DUF192 domain-containing protein [Hyphomicrobiaceae bacterium]|nr:DUF192 domain-containing protein [Hyphomicrobiaceae bacterium]
MQVSRVLAGAAGLVALLLFALYAFSWQGQTSGAPGTAGDQGEAGTTLPMEKLELVTSAGVRTLNVEVARTIDQQAKGLMFRSTLADDHGMLFPHDKPREVSMWMRNTYIPLDMVFIRADGTVHRIAERTEPLSEKIVSSQGEVAAVLELAGGAAERLGLKAGDKVRHASFGRAPD